jgi:hypothetical protein
MAESLMDSVQQNMTQAEMDTRNNSEFVDQRDEMDNSERLTHTQADVFDSIKPSMGVKEQRQAHREKIAA